MKRIFQWTCSVALFTTLLTALPAQETKAQYGASISLQVFYDQLAPYGNWIDDPAYGYVWVPNVSRDFRPYYTNGYWVMTSYGNMWVSDYSWGWGPFHYGRWTYDDYYGWMWIPGTEWAPAWVSWRTGGGYYGWAPLAPNISISISLGPRYHCPGNWWVFIPQAHIHSRSFYNYYRGPSYNVNIIHHTTVINYSRQYNHVMYAAGPSTRDVQRVTHRKVNVYNIRQDNRPGRERVDRNVVNVYRPPANTGRHSQPARPQQINRRQPQRVASQPRPANMDNNRRSQPVTRSPQRSPATTPHRSSAPARQNQSPANRERKMSRPPATERSARTTTTPKRVESRKVEQRQSPTRSTPQRMERKQSTSHSTGGHSTRGKSGKTKRGN